MRLYIAAPLFSPSELAFNDAIRDQLSACHEVHLPQRDGPIVAQLIEGGVRPSEAARRAYESDITAIKQCDVLIAVLDGRAIDEGVCVEIGFAKALGKHVIGFKSDMRRVLPWGNNPMLDGCVDVWVANVM